MGEIMTDSSNLLPKPRSEKAIARRTARVAERKARRKALRHATGVGGKADTTPDTARASIEDKRAGADVRKLLPRCRKLVAAGRWQTVVELTNDEQATLKHPRLLAFRLLAAQALRNQNVMEDVGRVVAMLPSNMKTKLATLRDLAKAGHGGLVARILLADPALHSNPKFTKLTPHIMRGMKDRSLRRQFRQALIAATGGGWLIKERRSSFVFAPRNDTSPVLGSLSLASGPRVPQHHLPNLHQQARKFRNGVEAAIAGNSQPAVRELEKVFTDRFGQIWTESGQIIRSRGAPIIPLSRASAPHLEMAMLSQSKTRGMYHWLVDRVARFAWLKEPANNVEAMPILVSDNAPQFELVCMEMMGLSGRA